MSSVSVFVFPRLIGNRSVGHFMQNRIERGHENLLFYTPWEPTSADFHSMRSCISAIRELTLSQEVEEAVK